MPEMPWPDVQPPAMRAPRSMTNPPRNAIGAGAESVETSMVRDHTGEIVLPARPPTGALEDGAKGDADDDGDRPPILGAPHEKSRVFEPGVIVGQMLFKNFVMLKVFLAAVVTGLVVLAVRNALFGVKLHLKPLAFGVLISSEVCC